MIIETKFNYRDSVYWYSFEENKILSGEVIRLNLYDFFLKEDKDIRIDYTYYVVVEKEHGSEKVVRENNLFKSKEELIENITNNLK